MIQLACNHHSCKPCLQLYFQEAMTDESIFPPKCCKEPIPPSLVLDATAIQMFREREVEVSAISRLYCADPSCAKFINPQNIESQVGTCPCGHNTCLRCRRSQHGGECQPDLDLDAVLQIASDDGWRRCRKCNGMIELTIGCNHIT